MTKQQFLEIIKKAEKCGYKEHLEMLPLPHLRMEWNKGDSFLESVFWNHRYEILFSHDFARAIFGEKDMWPETECTCGGVDFHVFGHDAHHLTCKRTGASRGYKFHLAKMVVEEDPFLYLENFCDR